MWRLITEQKISEEGISYTAYGFACEDCSVSDFSSVKAEAERLLDILNQNEVSAVHVYEVIEDYFACV